MKRTAFFSALLVAVCLPLLAGETKPADWHMNATVIEACSCPMFCQCYFNTKPAGHHDHGADKVTHYCRANNAYKINKGHYGTTKLDGGKFWIATDLGGDFFPTGDPKNMQLDWAVLYFDKALTKEQRDGIAAIAAQLFPAKWNSLTTAEGHIDKWEYNNDSAHATLDGGKTAEVKLKRFQGMTNEPVVIKNLKYWGAQKNDGFIMMPNEVEAYRVGPKAFEYKGTNGFMLTLDVSSQPAQTAAAGGK